MNPLLLKRLARFTRRPRPFEPAEREFWRNRYISGHVLNAHIEPGIDDASRKLATIEKSVEWIDGQIRNAPGREILDLGCGPGLYASRFARLGWNVVGIDFSRSSIRYARDEAKRSGAALRYLYGDYRRKRLPSAMSVAMMIYGDFCVVSDSERDKVLESVRTALSPGGYFVFDVFTKEYTKAQRLKPEWYCEVRDGFWHRSRHLALQQSVEYSEGTLLNRYLIVPAFGRTRCYHLWYRPFDGASIRELLESRGFSEVELYGDLTGAEYDGEGKWIGVVCKRNDAPT